MACVMRPLCRCFFMCLVEFVFCGVCCICHVTFVLCCVCVRWRLCHVVFLSRCLCHVMFISCGVCVMLRLCHVVFMSCGVYVMWRLCPVVFVSCTVCVMWRWCHKVFMWCGTEFFKDLLWSFSIKKINFGPLYILLLAGTSKKSEMLHIIYSIGRGQIAFST